MFDTRLLNLRSLAKRLSVSIFLIAGGSAVTGYSQLTRTVAIQFTGGCMNLPPRIYVVLEGDEAGQFSADWEKGGHWIGDVPSGPAIPPTGTAGSARLHGWRTGCQRSHRATYKGNPVASFTFDCDLHPTKDYDIDTSPDVGFSYTRRLPPDPTITDSCECAESLTSHGLKMIRDLRFPIGPPVHQATRGLASPFENMRVQLNTTKPPDPKDCGLLVSDPALIAALKSGPIKTPAIIQLFIRQRGEEKACQAPTLSSIATDIDEYRLPAFALSLKVKKDD